VAYHPVANFIVVLGTRGDSIRELTSAREESSMHAALVNSTIADLLRLIFSHSISEFSVVTGYGSTHPRGMLVLLAFHFNNSPAPV